MARGFASLTALLLACHRPPAPAQGLPPATVAFGSCLVPARPAPTLDVALAHEPDVFVFLGDNMYADTDEVGTLVEGYAELGGLPALQQLWATSDVRAIWDDHDYGWNDAGSEYALKEQSRELFLDFWRVPEDAVQRGHAGIYDAVRWDAGGHTLQLLLLDTRSFRDPLDLDDGTGKNRYRPTEDTGRTLLGAEQWTWLQQRLEEPADLRIVASSIQLGHTYNGWESWTLFPHELERFAALVRAARGATVVVSGDVHWGEISRVSLAPGHDLVDITSSGLNQTYAPIEDNAHRVGPPVEEPNVGLLEIDWSQRTLRASLLDAQDAVRAHVDLSFDELAAGP